MVLLPPASEGWRKVMFSLSPPFRGGGYPVSGLDGGGGTPSQVWTGGVPHPRSGWGGTPSCWQGVTHPRSGWGGCPILLTGGGYPIPGLEGGYPHRRSGWGVPPLSAGWSTPIQDWIGYSLPLPPPPHRRRALAKRWAVCLLRSRRRTFLLNLRSQL